ncbi:MAG: polysaccharide deacetylase family protein [Candidatus Omnitrophota bacterium]
MRRDVRIPILVYHRVSEDAALTMKDEADFYTVNSRELRKQLQHLSDNGYTAISLESLLQGDNMPDKPVVITFDDGDISNYNIAWPLLKELGLKASFFLIVRNIGTEGSLSFEQISRMRESGMEFGSHGLTHRFLTKLDKDILINELENSKDILSKQLGVPIDILSVPGGFYNSRVKKTIRSCGYRIACTSIQGVNNAGTDLLCLKRIAIRGDTDFEKFKSLLAMPDFAFLFKRFEANSRSVLKKIIGIRNYTLLKERLIGVKR